MASRFAGLVLAVFGEPVSCALPVSVVAEQPPVANKPPSPRWRDTSGMSCRGVISSRISTPPEV